MVINTDHPAALNAAKWLRTLHNIPSHKSIIPDFEKIFDCRVEITNLGQGNYIFFKDEKSYLWFLLQWS